jgi:hypothetical protein
VRVAGEEAFKAKALRTRLQTGFAGDFSVDVAGDEVEITVEVAKRRIKYSQKVTVDGATWLGISLGGGGDVETRISPEPFGYV